MAIQPITAFGRLRFNYVSVGRPHTVSFYVSAFDQSARRWLDPYSGSINVIDTANALAVRLLSTFHPDCGASFGEVTAEVLQEDGSYLFSFAFSADTTGTVSTGTSNVYVQAFNQATWVFRDREAKIVKFALFGQGIFSAGAIRTLAGLTAPPSPYRNLADWLVSAQAGNIVSRSNARYGTFKSAAWDSNERLRKEYNFV